MANLKEFLERSYDEIAPFKRRPPSLKRKIKIRRKRLHRGSNFEGLKRRQKRAPGMKRVLAGSKRYTLKRMSPKERVMKARVGTRLGRKFGGKKK